MKHLPPVLLWLPVPSLAQNYDTLIQSALQERNAGRFSEAEVLLREAYTLAADKREVTMLLGMVLAFQEKYPEAEALLGEGLASYPDDLQILLAQARVKSYQGQFAEAENILQSVLDLAPDNLDALNLAARMALYQNRFERGKQQYLRVLARDSRNLEALIGLYDADLSLGNRTEAEQHLALAALVAPGHVDVQNRLRRETDGPQIPRHMIITGYSASDINRPFFSDWQERFLEYRHFFDNGNQFYLRGEHAHRFSAHDTLGEAGMLVGARSLFPLEVGIAVSQDTVFMPESRYRLGVRLPVNRVLSGTSAQLVLQQGEYVSGTTRSAGLNLE